MKKDPRVYFEELERQIAGDDERTKS